MSVTLFAIDSRVTTALVVAAGLLIFGALLVATAAGELAGRRKAKVPPAMRPGPADEELERRVLERYMAWGAVATLFMALWLPAYWIREPTRQNENRVKFAAQAVTRGEEAFVSLCSTCHGEKAEGGVRQYVIDGVNHSYAEPPLRFAYSRYQLAGRKDDEITQLIVDAINRGRPGTPMPTWGLAFGGPLNPQQVDDIVAWLQSIQETFPGADVKKATVAKGEELFLANCAVCHNAPKANDQIEDNDPSVLALGGVGPNLTITFKRLTAQQVFNTIHNGRLNTNRPSMPAWAGLGDDAIKALVAFLQSIQRG